MDFLNKKATIVFGELIGRLDNGYLKIINDPFTPLSVEKVSTGIQTPWGSADLYSLCRYIQRNGDLVQDPEMCFLVLDTRAGLGADFDKLKIAPCMFWQAGLGIYEESAIIENAILTSFRRTQQKDHTVFANQWLINIREQGFLK